MITSIIKKEWHKNVDQRWRTFSTVKQTANSLSCVGLTGSVAKCPALLCFCNGAAATAVLNEEARLYSKALLFSETGGGPDLVRGQSRWAIQRWMQGTSLGRAWCVSGMRGRGAPGGRLIWRKITWNTVTFTQTQMFQKVEYNTGPCWGRFLGMHFLNWRIVDFNYSHWKSSISHWKDWCWSWNSNTLAPWCEELTHPKRPWCWERMRAEEKGTKEDEVVGWHHQINRHGFGWTPGAGDGQGGLVCCRPWGHKESDTTEQLNWTDSWYTVLC